VRGLSWLRSVRKVIQAMKSGRLVAAMAVAASVTFCALPCDDCADVRITLAPDVPPGRITELTVISGADKFWWPRIDTGDTKQVTLKPNPEDGDRELTFVFQRQGDQERTGWTGPPVPQGRGFRIAVLVDANGRVTARQCLRPCQLD